MASNTLEPLILEVETKLKTKITTTEEIHIGMNNRLFILYTTSKLKLLAKIYFKDTIPRLYNEFTSFEFLRNNGIFQVPTTYFKNENLNYAIYSFEEGMIKKTIELTMQDIENMLDFIIKLQSFRKDKISKSFNFAPFSINSLNDFIARSFERAHNITKHLSNEQSYKISPQLKNFLLDFNLSSYLNERFQEIKELTSQDVLTTPINISGTCLSVNDFGGANNTIFKTDGSATFIDFEYFGWDHPFRMIADFVNHIKNKELSLEHKQEFVRLYKSRSPLPTTLLEQLDIAIRLNQIEWVSIILNWLTPEKLESRKHGDPNFDEEKFIKERLKNLKECVDKI